MPVGTGAAEEIRREAERVVTARVRQVSVNHRGYAFPFRGDQRHVDGVAVDVQRRSGDLLVASAGNEAI